MIKFPFTIRQFYKDYNPKDEDVLNLFINNTDGYVIAYAEQPKYTGIWSIFETDHGPRNCNHESGFTLVVDLLIFDTYEHARDYYSPFGESGTITNSDEFCNGLYKIFRFDAILNEYKSITIHKVTMTLDKIRHPSINFKIPCEIYPLVY